MIVSTDKFGCRICPVFKIKCTKLCKHIKTCKLRKEMRKIKMIGNEADIEQLNKENKELKQQIKNEEKVNSELLERVRLLSEENRPDSMEFCTPSKGGVLKIYFNSADVIGSKYIVNNALIIRQHAR